MTLLATIALYYFNAGVWWWVAFGICAAFDVATAILRVKERRERKEYTWRAK
jgi:hypothetical protein